MITNLKDNQLTKSLATGAVAISILAGVGLASSPAQAGTFTISQSTKDTESGSPGELIWTTFPGFPTSGAGAEAPTHGIPGVNGYDNPLISHTGGGKFLIEYFGRGTASNTNLFNWTGPGNSFTWNNQVLPNQPNSFSSIPITSKIVKAVDGNLPFNFVADSLGINEVINNGDSYNGQNPHYFATIDGTYATTIGNMVYLGLSDRVGATGDDDASDFVIKITSMPNVPEPSTVVGLLAISTLGAVMKRKKRS